MDFSFTNDQQLLRQTAHDVIADVFRPDRIRGALDDVAGLVRLDMWSELAELGWSGVLIPEANGGSGGSVVDACILAEELASGLAPVPFVGTAIGVAGVAIAVGDEQVQRDVAAGSPLSLVLDRRLCWPAADSSLGWDWLPGSEAVLVAGDERLDRRRPTPLRFELTDPLHPLAVFDDLGVAQVVCSEAMRRAVAVMRVGVAASAVGLARAALHEAVEYSKERVQYGHPIAEFQAIQHICADMLVNVETSASTAYGAAWVVEHEPVSEAERVAASAVGWCVPAAIRTIEEGIQVLGGIGVTWEHDAHLRLRHGQLLSRLLGGVNAALELLAQQSLRLGEEVARGSA
ncbi:MAG: acyl-CoA dehydrogenase family protein [Acidimicrobiia bacterium]